MPLTLHTAIVNYWVPPILYGSAGKVYRLFIHLPLDNYCVVTSSPGAASEIPDGGKKLPCRYHHLPSEWRRIPVCGGWFREFTLWLNLWLKVIQRARNIRRVLLRERCRCAVTFTGECEDLPASFLAAKMAGCLFCLVIDDDYINQWTEAHKKWLSRQVGPFAVKHCDALFFVSESLREAYKRRYGVSGEVLHTPTLEGVGEAPAEIPIGRENGEIKIIFSGTVYELNADMVSAVLKAAALAAEWRVKVHLYTWQTRDQLSAMGVKGEFVLHKTESVDALLNIQRQSDILLLGLGFNPQHKDLVKTSFPSKLTDYLVSGRPILAVLPPESCAADFLRKNQCAHVVESADPLEIAEGISHIVRNDAYRVQLVKNAFSVAREEFDWRIVVAGFAGVINGLQHRGEAKI
jgi:glycosyltransferase involved in cell wall biosynthesis